MRKPLEPFWPGLESADEAQYKAYRNNPDWNRIYQFLRRDFWHVTSPEGWKQIFESDVIRPNIDGRFPKQFDSTTEKSFGYKNKFVCLFDFVSPTEEEAIRNWHKAFDVFVPHTQPQRILIRLSRAALEPKLIPHNASRHPETEHWTAGCIPFLEVWYPEDIPAAAIAEVFQQPCVSQSIDFNPQPI